MWTLLIIAIVVFWAIPRFYLSGPDMSRYDTPRNAPVRAQASEERHKAIAALGTMMASLEGPSSERLSRMRALMDEMGDAVQFDGEIRPVVADGVRAEWVLAPGADPQRRLLYVHGGAFTMGSPRSHRYLTTSLSRLCQCAVLAIDYRLMPEHSRMAGISDCQQAYRWIMDNGPDGPASAQKLFIAGDSAGGNLTLMLTAWSRDAGLRMPDATAALSPATDSTLASPSIRGNLPTDYMLAPMFGALARIPRSLWLLYSWFNNRIKPNEPLVSPLYGELSGLPPTLVQASESEVLLDDARRYVNRARASGSPVELQTWPDMLHVWQAFGGQDLPESAEALERIAAFFQRA